jgi:anti-anti-sigma regulatory factor
MGKIDIDCRDEKDTIIIDILPGRWISINSNDLSRLIGAYIERGFKKFILKLGKVTYLDSSIICILIHFF